MLTRLRMAGLRILLSLFASTCSVAFAGPNNLIKEAGKVLDIENNLQVFEDPSASLGPVEVLKKLSDFKDIGANDLTMGYTNSAFWVLFDLENQSSREDLELAANYPVVKIMSYQVIDPATQQIEAEQTIDRRTPSSSLHIKQGKRKTFLVKVTSSQFLSLQFKVSDAGTIAKAENFENMLFAMLFGCFLTAFITNFLMFLNLRKRGYLYYLIFSFVNCHLMFLAIKFPADILHWGHLDWAHLVHPYSTLGAFTTFLFVRNFLQTKKEFPRLDFAMKLFMTGLLLIATLELIAYSPSYPNFADMYYQVGIVLLIWAGVSSFRHNFLPSRYYLLSLLCFLGGIVTFLSLTLGYLPSNAFTLNALVIGQTGEMLLMSLALGSKLKLIERESSQSLMKTQLLKVLAHDIATPLSIIKLSTQYARVMGPEKSFSQIARASESIEDLIHYIHERRIIDTNRTLSLSNISINAVFTDVAFAYKDRADAKGITLKIVKNDPDLLVFAHHSNLAQQVLGNLVSNAIKFTRINGEIVISAAPRGRRHVAIIVRDQGEGMPKSTIDTLLREANRNISQLGTSGEKGFGYGLSIVKDSLKNFKGTLEISNAVDSKDSSTTGTIVRVVLYRARFNFDKVKQRLSTINIINPAFRSIHTKKTLTE